MRVLLLLTLLTLAGCGGLTTKLCGAVGQPCCAQSTCDEGATCGANELCEAGLSCGVTCTLGTSRCANNGLETCAAAGVCPEWRTTLVACPSGSVCTASATSADCVETCPGACTPDTQLCTSEGLRRCEASGTCPMLVAEQDDTEFPICITGGVISAELSWESPTPLGNHLVDIAGELSSSYWVLDDQGNIIRYALGPWEFELRPTPGKRMRRLASCGLGSILYAAGENGTVFRRSGGMWTEENVGATVELTGITCNSTQAFASSADGRLFIRSGSTWTGYATGVSSAFTDVTTLFSQQQAFLSGPGGVIVRCDYVSLPPACAAESSGTTQRLNAIWGDTFTNTVWAVGENGTLLQRTATGWQTVPLTGVTDAIVGVTGWHDSSITTTTIAAISRSGKAIIRRSSAVEDVIQLPDSEFTNAWVPNGNAVVFTAHHGGLWFRNGVNSMAPFVARGGRKPITANLNAVTSVGQGRLFAVGDGGARVKRQNNTWSVDALGTATTSTLRGVAARSAGEVYAVGDDGTVLVRRWGTWVAEALGLTTESLQAVVLDTEHVWVLGQTQLLEKDLTSGVWRPIALPSGTPRLRALALKKDGSGKATELVVAGDECTVLSLSFTDDSFTPGPACGARFDITAAAFLASGDLIVGTETGSFHRRTGATFTFENAPINLSTVRGLIPEGSSMWAVGSEGRFMRRVATSWMDAAYGLTEATITAGVADDEGLFVVGNSGLVLRRQ